MQTILFYSNLDNDSLNILRNHPEVYPICVDSKDMKDILLNSTTIKVSMVPFILEILPDGTTTKYEAAEVFIWSRNKQQLQYSEPVPVMRQTRPSKKDIYDEYDPSGLHPKGYVPPEPTKKQIPQHSIPSQAKPKSQPKIKVLDEEEEETEEIEDDPLGMGGQRIDPYIKNPEKGPPQQSQQPHQQQKTNKNSKSNVTSSVAKDIENSRKNFDDMLDKQRGMPAARS